MICAIALIMGYLVWVVVPMLMPASIQHLQSNAFDVEDVLNVSSHDTFESIEFIRSNGTVEFRDSESLEVLKQTEISPDPFLSVKHVFPNEDMFVALTDKQELLFFSLTHRVRFDGDVRSVENDSEVLFEGSTVALEDSEDYDVYREDTRLLVASLLPNGEIKVFEFDDIDNNFELEDPREATVSTWGETPRETEILLGPRGRWLYQFDSSTGEYRLVNTASIRRVRVEAEGSFSSNRNRFAHVTPVLGRYSLLVADDSGGLRHWSLGPSANGTDFQLIREFSYRSPIKKVITENRRKGFLAVDQAGTGHLGYTTSSRTLTSISMGNVPRLIAFSPRADRLVSVGETTDVYKVSNKHPEVSWGAFWGRVWFEGYGEPEHTWQSSSADTDFEPKFSLVPLLFGTIKAAFYTMLFATPLAIMGAIYTAMFMSPAMRRWIKPGIEIMAALPTVILGFLAGLWLAPIVESHLTSVFLVVFVLPIGVLICAFLTTLLPNRVSGRFDGWFAALSVPILVVLAYFIFANDAAISHFFFGMDAKTWLYEEAGVDYDQRNALVIGIAMGLAVIPVIFSISEDAIYGVPQHLVRGSLALGATRWQTLVRVVLLTASPGIFSAVMIGLGRAVGETMIVLMATGNTPIMDVNIFEGMRTFAANIAVEMPESEVGSTHFRILFLTAFVLFVLTFALNTIAEVVRQKLRKRYGNL